MHNGNLGRTKKKAICATEERKKERKNAAYPRKKGLGDKREATLERQRTEGCEGI